MPYFCVKAKLKEQKPRLFPFAVCMVDISGNKRIKVQGKVVPQPGWVYGSAFRDVVSVMDYSSVNDQTLQKRVIHQSVIKWQLLTILQLTFFLTEMKSNRLDQDLTDQSSEHTQVTFASFLLG